MKRKEVFQLLHRMRAVACEIPGVQNPANIAGKFAFYDDIMAVRGALGHAFNFLGYYVRTNDPSDLKDAVEEIERAEAYIKRRAAEEWKLGEGYVEAMKKRLETGGQGV